MKPFIEQGLATNSRGDSHLDVSEVSKDRELIAVASIFLLKPKQVQNRFMSGSKRNKRALKLTHVRPTPSNQTFPTNFLGEGVYHSPAEILSLTQKNSQGDTQLDLLLQHLPPQLQILRSSTARNPCEKCQGPWGEVVLRVTLQPSIA